MINHAPRTATAVVGLTSAALFAVGGTVLGLSSAGAALPGGVSQTQACVTNASSNQFQIDTQWAGTAPETSAAGQAVTLTAPKVEATLPGAIFVTGYNLGLVQDGAVIPGTVKGMIEGVNTVEGVKPTNVVATSIGPIDIADPDGIKSTGDETAGPVTLSVTFADMAFTASGTGPVSFREDTSPITPTPGPGLLMVANLGFNVQIRCSPGTVAGSEPGVVTLIDPAAAFAPTAAITPPTIPPTTLPTTPPTTPPTTTPTTTAPATTAPTTAAPTTTTPTTTPAPPAKQNTTTAAKAKYSAAKKKATVTVAVKGADGKPGTGSVKVTVKLGTKKIKTITAALSSSGVAKAVFKKIAAKGKYKVTVKYAGSATTNASSGKTTFKVA